MRVAKLEMADMMPITIPQTSLEPEALAGCWMMGPSPWALTTAQMKNAMPAVGTTYALTVNRCRILCTGNQIAGREINQKMKKQVKSRVFVPELGMPLLHVD